MTYNEIISQATRLPLKERLTLLETVSHSVREELKPAMARPRSAGWPLASLHLRRVDGP